MTFDEVVLKYVSHLNDKVDDDCGTFNMFCPSCFYRQGHPVVWCDKCGSKMVKYMEQSVRLTWRMYFVHASTDEEMGRRLNSFIHKFNHEMDFAFIWYYKDSNCTTPLFVSAIMKVIKESK